MFHSPTDDRIKVLPLVALAALVLFCLKAVSLWTGVGDLMTAIPPAEAAGKAPEQGGSEDAPAADDSHRNVTVVAPEGAGEGVSFGVGDFGETPDPARLSESEVKVLEHLAQRREALNKREREIGLKNQLLAATEKRIEERIAELKSLEARIQSLMIRKDKEKEAQIASLVKVYENMKAKDAARIFENLDKDILIAVAARMREAKVAAILAQMDPKSAQNLTVMLANPETRPKAEGKNPS